MFGRRFYVFILILLFAAPPILFPVDNVGDRIDKKIAQYKITDESKRELLSHLKKHILSYSHLERKAALYGNPKNLYYSLNDDSISSLPDQKFFETIMMEFAKQRDSHTRAYYPDYMSCVRADLPIEFSFYRDSDKENSWGKVIVTKVKDNEAFKDVAVGDELLQIDDLEIKQDAFESLRTIYQERNRGFYEVFSKLFLNSINGRYLPMPKKDNAYLSFRDYKTGELKEYEVKWNYDYSKCKDVTLFKEITFQERKKEKVEFDFKGKKYTFEKMANPGGVTDQLYITGMLSEKGVKDSPLYGFIKFFDFITYQDHQKGETINEFMDKTLISLSNLMNIFGDKKIKGLIIDVRLNPGGWVEFSHHIARVFSRGKINSVIMQFANGDDSIKNLLDEITLSENEIKKINSKGIWSGFPYTRAFFNWDNYKSALEEVKGTSLRLAKGLPHFKEPALGLNPLSEENDFKKVLVTDVFCYSSCDMFVSIFRDNKLGKVIGETTGGSGGMVYEGSFDLNGLLDGNKKIKSKFPFRYAYTNVLTPNFETIEDVGVKPDVYYRSELSTFRDDDEDGAWIAKAINVMNPSSPVKKPAEKKKQP